MANAKEELATIQSRLANLVRDVKSAGRDLTDAEIASVETDAARATDLKASIERGQRGADFLASLAVGGTDRVDVLGDGAKRGFLTPDSIKSMVRDTVPQASKALVTGGTSVTPVALGTEPVKLGTPSANLGLLGLIPVTVRDTPSYSYVRQVTRTNAAAVVASGALKPTSILTVEPVNSTLAVVAHVSEYIDTYLLQDNASLDTFVESELRDGIFAKVTALAVAAYNGASGVQTQAFSSTVADSIWLGLSKVVDLGYNPDTILLSRATLDALVLAKDTTGAYGVSPISDDGKIWGVLTPVVATGLSANSALVLDSSRVGISTDRQGIVTKWDGISKFDYNQTRALVEGRFAFDIISAPAIAKVSLV